MPFSIFKYTKSFVAITLFIACGLVCAAKSSNVTTEHKIVGALTSGSLIFNKVEMENLTYVNEKTQDAEESSVEIKIYYPQIKDPKNSAQKEWNEYIKSIWPDITHASCEGNTGNFEVNFSVNYASEHIISIFRNGWWHCPRASHGYSRNSNINTLIGNGSIKELSMSDLFNPDTDWKNKVFEMAMKRLKFETMSNHKDSQNILDYNKPRLQERYNEGELKYFEYSYNITAKGIKIMFGSVGGFMYGDFFADIPWAEIDPFLSDKIRPYLPL